MATRVFVQVSIRSSSSVLHSHPESSSSSSSSSCSSSWSSWWWSSLGGGWQVGCPEGPCSSPSSGWLWWELSVPLVLASDMQVIKAIHFNGKPQYYSSWIWKFIKFKVCRAKAEASRHFLTFPKLVSSLHHFNILARETKIENTLRI